ncbi:MAG: DUF1080 domain-containing protein [Paraglaciecola sp.]|nr:DUF1080 domain-containing protein [Paraglaciecola sp.]NCT49265.1 DUF1080 domain-containing protein [Paraglaciecola sp.]
MRHTYILLVAGSISLATASNLTMAAEQQTLEPWQLAEKTEVWDPEPPIVQAPAGPPPSDAIVLIGDGKALSQWQALKGGEPQWKVTGDTITVKPETGDIVSKQSFCDIQLHLEWKTPTDVAGKESQQRNNSGVFLQQRYEIQILDSYNNRTYANGQTGSVYKQTIPLANAMRPPGEWQVYDIIFQAPRFEGERLTRPGFVTVIHNGVLLQNHTEIQGSTEWIGPPSYKTHGCAPLQLQDHGNLVSFRNMWVRQL